MLTLQLHNTLGRVLETITPLAGNAITLYVCGITPYDYAHLGHGRCYTTFDLLTRLLRALDYQVQYIRNVTDIDDKILARAAAGGDILSYRALAQHFESLFREDMAALNCQPPSYEPRVTEHIPQIISLIEVLLDRGCAYALGNDIYFDVQSFPEYGKLSGRLLDSQLVGARVEVREGKRNPEDFVLWKGNSEKQFWSAPWGYGRPGWHIECSALAQEYLGPTIDIHGGGMDLIFPHHENEIAQSESANSCLFSRMWVHNAFVTVKSEKMSKSLGNFATLRDVFTEFDPQIVRFYYLQHHYRTPIDFSTEGLIAAQKAYTRLIQAFALADAGHQQQIRVQSLTVGGVAYRMVQALCDDLNSPQLLGIVFESLAELARDPHAAAEVKAVLTQVMGLPLKPLAHKQVVLTPEIETLIEERNIARAHKDWTRADALREQLRALGVEVQDTK